MFGRWLDLGLRNLVSFARKEVLSLPVFWSLDFVTFFKESSAETLEISDF